MSIPAAEPRRGRRGRRTATMIRVARERIFDLFGLAEVEARRGNTKLSDRYVRLARRIGSRYNLRFIPEHRDLYCRRCGAYWVEGLTVRTRLRSGCRVKTCLRCGQPRRSPIRLVPRVAPAPELGSIRPATEAESVLVEEREGAEDDVDEGDEEPT